jgi:shikimate dehydrogenase
MNLPATDTGGVLIDAATVETWDDAPLYLFIGISTAGSSIHAAFPVWAPLLAPGAVLRGVDLPETADPAEFRRLAIAMRDNPLVRGAVITSHKLRMYDAIADLIDHADPVATITHELNAIDTRNGIRALARDPQSLGILLDAMTPEWIGPGRSMICIGSGGAATALMLAMGLDIPATITSGQAVRRAAEARRGSLTILGVDPQALAAVRAVQQRAGIPDTDVTTALATTPTVTGTYTRHAGPGSVIVNATGLGKTTPGSPLARPEDLPHGVLAWDFNYRGPLTFLQQAEEAGAATMNGWNYFLAGWTAALAAITSTEFTTQLFDQIRTSSTGIRMTTPSTDP